VKVATPVLSTEFFDARETREPAAREADLMARLPGLIADAQSRAPGWGRILAGVDPAAIRSRADLCALPVTRKNDLKPLQAADPPFGGLNAVPLADVGHIFMSPGPIFDLDVRRADWWRVARAMHAAGMRRGMLIQNCFSYHFTPAAFMIEAAAAHMGCPVLPAGVGQTEMQVEAMAALKVPAYAGTPSFLKIILEKAMALGADVSALRSGLFAAEALPPSLRQWFHDHGLTCVLQWYGTAEIGLIAYETQSAGTACEGMVVDEDLLVEVVRPGTGEPVAEGEVGELVVTDFNADYPLVRFGTGDLTAILPGISPCGRTNVRIRGWLGRADQTTKVRAMFVHPGQIDQIMKRHPELLRVRLVVSGNIGEERMTLYCEAQSSPDGLAARVAESIRDITKLRGEALLTMPGSLPNDGKVIEDARSYQ
jgi:phenylacetate-CoA ligase